MPSTSALATPSSMSHEALRAQAELAAGAGRHADSLQWLKQAERLEPRSLEIQIDLSVAEFESGNFSAAMQRCEAILHENPGLDECAFLRALSLEALGNLPQAAQLLGELVHGGQAGRFARRAPGMAAHARARLARIGEQLRSCADAPGDGRLRDVAGSDEAPRWSAVGPAKYDLGHLTQPGHQKVAGPVQDDEALLLYALVRVMRMRRILEVGGLAGYSARNFLHAMEGDRDIALYSVDLQPVPSLAPWHYTIQCDCAALEPADVHEIPLDLIFFDAHVVTPQLALLKRLEDFGLLHPNTVLALHDTNLHKAWSSQSRTVREADGQMGVPHQPAEREMVNLLHQQGWEAVCLHMTPDRCDTRLGVRHGLTLMRRFHHLAV